ncbi:Uncharacterised protein [Pseudomonas aeruginosa]|nr:Uncharacterised protein [Pseudomonas aeruginosa]
MRLFFEFTLCAALGLLVSGVILIFLLFFGKFGLIEYWIASGKPLATPCWY